MRKLLLFTCLLFISASWSSAQGPIPELMWYQFNGAGTTVPNDASSPVQPTATILGSITQGTPGICNGALIGSGNSSTTDYLNTGWAPNLGTGAWTISVRVEGIAVSGTLFYIFGDAGASSFRCFTNGVAGNNNWILRGAGLTDSYINGGAQTYATMITYVYTGSSATDSVIGYLNGVRVSATAQLGTPNLVGAGPFKVMGYSSNVGAPAGGKMDDFRFYNRALTPAEVLAVYNGNLGAAFLGPDQTSCMGDTVTLSAPGGNTYLWSNSATSSSIQVPSAGTYSVTVTGACGNGADTATVNFNPMPTPSITGDSAFCSGDTIMLDAGTYPTFNWSNGDTLQMTNVNTGGMYSVEVIDSNGCSGFDTVMVMENMLPTPPAIPDTAICDGETFVADAGAGFSGYLWSTSGTGQTESFTTAGTNSVEVTDANGCSATDMFDVTVNPAPTPDLGTDISFCAGGNAVLDAGAGYSMYDWSNLATTQTTTVSTAGTYMVTVTDSLGCTGTDDIMVTVDPLPVASFTDNPSGLTVAFTSTSTDATTYAWNFGDTQTSTMQNPSHTYTSAGTYTVTLIVTNPCGSDTTTSTITVTSTSVDDGFFSGNVSLYPNPATNQVTFTAELPGTRDLSLTLLNAVGQQMLVRQEESVNGIFNATLNVDQLPAGVYFVKLTAGEHQTTLRLVVNQ